MKKFMLLSAIVMGFVVLPAASYADGHGGKGKMFEKKDANGDGVISKDEFIKAQEEKFSEMDADGSGDISKEEASAAHEARREKMKEHKEKRQERREERRENAADE